MLYDFLQFAVPYLKVVCCLRSEETLASLSYFLGVYRNLLEHANLFSENKKVTRNTQSEHLFRATTACPDTKLNHEPRVSNGLDTDHD